jgi:predicted RNA-binding Zn-ribbon protein involved in translation (DUF1610 family)
MADLMGGKCWNCGAELGPGEYGRETNCLGCGKPTRICKNCRWHAPGRPNDCEEPVAEPVADKTRANYCEFFEPTANVGSVSGDSADAMRQAAEDLFKF